jgi:tetratricopeptide (TPR) repeat protein
MADCERALGRPQAAIKLAKEARHVNLPPPLQVEMIIVEAGARADLGQSAEALRLLEEAVEAVQPRRGKQQSAVARLEYAYADALLRQGRADAARHWFASAAELDVEQSTDAAERRDELDGLIIDFDDAEPDDTRSDEARSDEARSDEAAPEAGR